MILAKREASEGAPHGALVLAEEQTAGRGRRGRTFDSPPGENLYLTMVLRLSLDVHRRLPLAIPLAVCIACSAEGVDARIKWPNDIWVGQRKLSGMLIDADLGSAGPLAMPGIGINVNGDPTTNPDLRDTATSLRRELNRPIVREKLLARICNELERVIALDPASLATEYRSNSMILGREMLISSSIGDSYLATAEDIRDDGCLIARLPDGSRRTLIAEDVSVRPSSTR
jgi:BirA family biotin operon repressor/biotin-[acetyl-CoA-carboxylase] ligase